MKLTSRLQLWIALMLVIIAVLIAACSDKPSIPDLSSWLGKAETPYNFVKLEEGVFAVLVKNADGKVDRIVLTEAATLFFHLSCMVMASRSVSHQMAALNYLCSKEGLVLT